VAINDQGGSAFGEGTAEGVHTRNAERNCLHNARATTLAKLHCCAGYAASGHSFTHIRNFPAKFIHEYKSPINFFKIL
jgi:hypothetical protein